MEIFSVLYARACGKICFTLIWFIIRLLVEQFLICHVENCCIYCLNLVYLKWQAPFEPTSATSITCSLIPLHLLPMLNCNLFVYPLLKLNTLLSFKISVQYNGWLVWFGCWKSAAGSSSLACQICSSKTIIFRNMCVYEYQKK